jgi:hypothetical protein
MYNYSIELKYKNLDIEDSDTQYRKEVLAVFSMKEYNQDMIKKQDTLFNVLKDEYKEIIKCIMNNDRLALIRNVNENDAFMILFSWDYFYDNHNLIRAILKKDNKNIIDNLKQKLKNIIIKNN